MKKKILTLAAALLLIFALAIPVYADGELSGSFTFFTRTMYTEP